VVLAARDAAGAALVGGANFIAFPLRPNAELLSINFNYTSSRSATRRVPHRCRAWRRGGCAAAVNVLSVLQMLYRVLGISTRGIDKVSTHPIAMATSPILGRRAPSPKTCSFRPADF
jgi:hypothetical protein